MKQHTVTVQIGNSDNKLTQEQWSRFVKGANQVIAHYATTVHFYGFSVPDAPWQNAAWVFICSPSGKRDIQRHLSADCARFCQDSITWTDGETEFLTGENYEQLNGYGLSFPP